MSTSGEYVRVSTWVSKTLSVTIKEKAAGRRTEGV